METQKKKKLTASEKRFVQEVEKMVNMSLEELMRVEKHRMPIGV